MAATDVEGVEERWSMHPDHPGSGASFFDAQRRSELVDLVLQAHDALPWGVLVISREGWVCSYNAAYARLRHIAPGALVGRPVEKLDRRQRLRTLLRSGSLPPEPAVGRERRQHRESLIPLQEAGELLGVAVVVAPAGEAEATGHAGLSQRAPGHRGGESAWQHRYTFADISGNSPALAQARELARQSAQGASAVLVIGESGTGKELFAHAIHAASPHQACPFVPVDCAAIPRDLLEAELFGYVPGAFTGAVREGKAGKFELAHGGTIFLDEIGEMPLDMQVKLLRVLQEHRITRVGGVTPIPVVFTVIAATNQDLESLAAQGRFRRDLLYRLDVIRIEVPALRERPEDISPLVAYYWERKSRELGKVANLSAKALQVLERYSWPGNVRELVNVVERLLVCAGKPVIEATDLPFHIQQGAATLARRTAPFHLEKVLAEVERETLERALRQANGNRNKAAELVGLSRASFYRKLKAYESLLGDHKPLSNLL